jgi:hypothetical protein
MSNQKTELNTKKEFSLQNKKHFFEKIKYKNFVHSSKLEGINITPINEDMVQLIQKYKIIGNHTNGR